MSSSKNKPFKLPGRRSISGPQGSSTKPSAKSKNVSNRRQPPSSPEPDEFDSTEASSDDHSDASMGEAAPALKRNEALEPAIPPQLLIRLVHEHFKHDDTRITTEAMSVLDKYVQVFTMEALGRANAEREEAAEEAKRNGKNDVDMGFLEVEDLEKLAPQLLLDI